MNSLSHWWARQRLRSDNVDAQVAAAERLSGDTDARSWQSLLVALEDDDPEVRAQAAVALGKIRDRRVVEALVAIVLGSKGTGAVQEATEALRRINDPRAIDALLEALNVQDAAERQAAACALRKIGWGQLTDAQRAHVAVVSNDWHAAVAIGSGAVEPLVHAVRTGTAHARRRAADSLGEISGRAAVSALIGIVEDADEDRAVREVAAWALDKYTEELLTDVQHALVAVMLGHWADVVFIGARAIGPLEAALQDDDEARRERAAQALADIGTREALDVLVASLPDRTQISQVKRVALEAIGGRGDDRTQPLAAAALNDADFEVRRSAAELLERKGWQPETCGDRILYAIAQERWDAVRAEGERAVPMLVEALDCPAIRPEAVQALVGTGDPGMTALVDVLSDETRPVPTREVAAMAVAAAGDERAIERLTAMLRDKDMAMRQMAVWALQRSGWEPKDDNGRAAILIANERWSELGDLGAAAVEPLLRLVTERMAVPEAVGALGDVLESAPERVSIRQLRAIHALRRMFQADAPRTGGSPDQIKVDGVRVDFSRIQQLAKRELFHRGIVVQ